MNINKKLIILIVAVALVGGFFGSLAAANLAKANIFQEFYDKFI